MDFSNVEHNPCLEEITDLICRKTQNTDKGFFHVEVAYFLSKMAASMRAYIDSADRGQIPVNCYAICLATSGYSKGYSVNIMEDTILSGFRREFCGRLFHTIADRNINARAEDIAVANQLEVEDVLQQLKDSYNKAGNYVFTFDSGTSPAVKQMRNKLLLSEIGAINFEQDELASNLLSSTDVIAVFLELYDQGKVKTKLIKNTSENVRDLDIDGKTPANMLLFGTPVKLFDGGTTEDFFYSMLDTGYARRCLFGYGLNNDKKAYYSQTAEEIYEALVEPKNKEITDKWNSYFTSLAQESMYNFRIELQKKEAIQLLEYRIECEKKADELSQYAEIQKAELNHRYFKALKLAGTYAFIERANVISRDHLMQAIKLVEESGENFLKILNREKSYMKLANYLASVNEELTHADLTEALPFYKSTQRNELLSLATAWGYKHHILIKKTFSDGVEFMKGEALEETNLNNLIISYSTDFANNYISDYAPFDQLATNLFKLEGMNWCNHHFKDGHRANIDALSTFNMVVLDVDGDISLNTAERLLKDYIYILYTTKRHTEEINRFRVVLPIKYTLSFDLEDYKAFMNNILSWMPFKSDEAANQPSKKWLTNPNAEIRINSTGSLLDPTKFIPNTFRNDSFLKDQKKINSFDNLERWFAKQIEVGNRNNLLLKYALCLVDNGLDLEAVEEKVLGFNKKLKDKLPEEEIQSTILVTARKHWFDLHEKRQFCVWCFRH